MRHADSVDLRRGQRTVQSHPPPTPSLFCKAEPPEGNRLMMSSSSGREKGGIMFWFWSCKSKVKKMDNNKDTASRGIWQQLLHLHHNVHRETERDTEGVFMSQCLSSWFYNVHLSWGGGRGGRWAEFKLEPLSSGDSFCLLRLVVVVSWWSPVNTHTNTNAVSPGWNYSDRHPLVW